MNSCSRWTWVGHVPRYALAAVSQSEKHVEENYRTEVTKHEKNELVRI